MNFLKDIIDYIQKLFTWWIVVMPWEQGIRVTLGKKTTIMNGGIYLKLPLIHTCYVQEKRLRTINTSIQTISTKDHQVISIGCTIGYSINDISKLFNTLYQPDMTVASTVLGVISDYIFNHNLAECLPKEIEKSVSEAMGRKDYGLKFEIVRITTFASVKTFRLIQDQSQMWEGLDLLVKR